MQKKPKLTLVELERPKLAKVGTKLWDAMLGELQITEARDLETLSQICSAADRAEQCAQIIARDGPVIETKSGPREHPLLRHRVSVASLRRAFTLPSQRRVDRTRRPASRWLRSFLQIPTGQKIMNEREQFFSLMERYVSLGQKLRPSLDLTIDHRSVLDEMDAVQAQIEAIMFKVSEKN